MDWQKKKQVKIEEMDWQKIEEMERRRRMDWQKIEEMLETIRKDGGGTKSVLLYYILFNINIQY